MNPVMIDMRTCGCRVLRRNQFACVDGPEFDGALIDFDLAMSRSRFMKDLEE